MKKLLLMCLAFSLAIMNIASVKAMDLPRLDHADLEVSPTITGVNGTLLIQTIAQVDGTC